MLELKNIVKNYPAGGEVVRALKGVSLTFRDSEFVAILGPSGCGKTTLLNIVGGLDQYTSGDLIINGKSTRDFKDRDWDTYRNHSVGFVFQSYNLIPHQTVLQNVELALTLSGVKKAERRARAKKALEEVGLGNQLNKHPSEMSGGQMQRVAIARAIVNDPDIILADEPTGALDSETSVQVMDILKEISKNRLIIMVTHNPDLADRYATRTVRILDGELQSDSAPLTEEETQSARKQAEVRVKEEAKKKKPSMSFATSFGLSLKNLFTKRGRTALTSFAGSIGIIGIALIYAVSQGTTMYINTVQEETLSSSPLILEASNMDVSTLLETFIGKAESNGVHENDAVYQKSMFYNMMNSLLTTEAKTNDLKSFKAYLDRERADENSKSGLNKAVSGVQYSYNNDFLIYTKNVDGEIIPSDTQELLRGIMKDYLGMDFSSMTSLFGSSMMSSSSMMESSSNLWQELLPGSGDEIINPLVKKQYELIDGGRWPEAYNEILLVVDKDNELNDMTLYAMGLKSSDEIEEVLSAVKNHTEIKFTPKKWTYDEIKATDFRTILPADCYNYDEATGTYTDLRKTPAGLQYLYDNALTLKVVGILRPADDSISKMLTGSIVYTTKLTEYLIEQGKVSKALKAQQDDEKIDIFTGLPFKDSKSAVTEAEKAEAFRKQMSLLGEKGKADAYRKIMSVPSDELVAQTVAQTLGSMTREQMEQMMIEAFSTQMSMSPEEIKGYISSMSDEQMKELFSNTIVEKFKAQYAEQVSEQLDKMSTAELAGAFDLLLGTLTDEMSARYYDEVLDFSDSTYEANLAKLGYVELDNPSRISIYASTFAAKDTIKDAIAEYNKTVDDLSEINYTDVVGFIMSSVTTIIDAISYVLIAFVSVSLIVSSIMIGVITLISVQERTKEIGILRAIGASKKNVSNMFNAETVIIGFTSGLLGVVVTYLLIIPINLILHSLTGIGNLSAYLPPVVGLVLILISMLLTLVAGIIPSRSAAKKDPVVALRTE